MQMIDFPINSASQNHRYFISPPKSAEQSSVSKNSVAENKDADKHKVQITGKIWIGLGALAAAGIASIGIYRAAKGRQNIPPAVSDTTINLLELKAKIKTDYLNKKNEILKTFNFDADNDEIQKYRNTLNNVSGSVKNKLQNLSVDSDWLELRKIRKKLLKTLKNEKNSELHDIADKKIELLNNVLISKIHPEEEESFKSRFLMDLSDAAELIKKDFTTFEEFKKMYSEKQKYEFELDFNEKLFFKNSELTLRDLFPEEMKEYDFAKAKIRELYDEPKQARLEKLKSLAKEFRVSQDIKTFKKINAENA